MTRVLFVCLGNICRSPLAEGLFNKKLEDRGLSSGFKIDSAGTSAYHVGELPDPRTRLNARQNGLHLISRARQFNKADFHDFDLILAMDDTTRKHVLALVPENTDKTAKVMLMRDYDVFEKGKDVPDPYYLGENGFNDVYTILDRCTDSLINELIVQRTETV
jgi:protein-tyrosine phosphatase